MRDFVSLFKFDSSNVLSVGVERERFLVDDDGWPVPRTKEVLQLLPDDGTFGYELSACQLEDRVGPVSITELRNGLQNNDAKIDYILSVLGIRQAFYEVAQKEMDLTVFDDPSGRYQQIVKKMPIEKLLAACQVAGTHVHVGMPNLDAALWVYNEVIPECGKLCKLIDNSHGERLDIYKTMEPDYEPRAYASIEDFYNHALAKKFDKDPRQNWQLIRITIHGTIEFRMGGATASHDEVCFFAESCHDLCSKALERWRMTI